MRRALASLYLICSLAAIGTAERLEIRRDTVLEATSNQDLSIARSREGDRFSVTLRESRDIPRGTRVEGEVSRVEPKRGDQSAYIDLEFTDLITPNNRRQRISALPISLDDRKIRRDRNGRLSADSQKHKSEQYVFGGLLGGLIVGAIVKKPFEGAFAGTLAGIIISELERDRAKKSENVLRKGTRIGVLFTEDARFDWDDRDQRFDRWDDDRNRDDRDNRDDRYDRDDRNDRNHRGGLEYEGRAIGGSQSLLRQRDGVLVPISMARSLNIEVEQVGDRIYLEHGSSVMRLTVGSADYRIMGGSTGRLPVEVTSKDREVYVPAEALAAVLPGQLRLDGMIIRRPS